jgi:hypothetical protein
LGSETRLRGSGNICEYWSFTRKVSGKRFRRRIEMYPPVVQFETKQMELEALLGLYGEREALAQRALDTRRHRARRRRRLHLRAPRPSAAPCPC